MCTKNLLKSHVIIVVTAVFLLIKPLKHKFYINFIVISSIVSSIP